MLNLFYINKYIFIFISSPLFLLGLESSFNVNIKVSGGGIMGQSDAIFSLQLLLNIPCY